MGQKVKQQKFNLKMVRGEHYINTKMAGDFMTLWEGLKRSVNMIPFGSKDISNICLVYFLLLEPFMLLPFSVYLVFIQSPENTNLSQILLTIDLMSIVLIISVIVIQLSINLSLSPFYAVFGPIACTIISIAFIFIYCEI